MAKRHIKHRGYDYIRVDVIRRAFANYTLSEGCGCCSDYEEHSKSGSKIAELLKVDEYDDCSGYDFNKYRTNPIVWDKIK